MSRKFVVNAALQKLVARSDTDGSAARTVIEFGTRLKQSWPLGYESRHTKTIRKPGRQGLAPGVGSVDQSPGRKVTHEHAFGTYQEHVGYYRIWKQEEGLILFRDYRDTSTSPECDEYHLAYEPKTLALRYFGVRMTRSVTSFTFGRRRLRFERPTVRIIYGQPPRRFAGLPLFSIEWVTV